MKKSHLLLALLALTAFSAVGYAVVGTNNVKAKAADGCCPDCSSSESCPCCLK
jgi:hypothetical protein